MSSPPGDGPHDGRHGARVGGLLTDPYLLSMSGGVVSRARLLERLELAAEGPFTLVSAPAGTGKTELVLSWVASGKAPGPVVWVSIEHGYDSLGRFWSHVIDALREHNPPITSVAPAGHAEDVDPALLGALAADIATSSQPVVLVLDCGDLTDTTAAGTLDFVLRHSAGNLRLVMLTRSDPVLPLHRYRLAGVMTEIRTAELAFTVGEASVLLAESGIDLSETSLHALLDRTHGWAAGLRFAAMFLSQRVDQERAVRDFTGNTVNVAEYLITEVLDAAPPAVRDLLLKTSILDVLRPELAETLAGHGGSRALAFLQRGNVLIEDVWEQPGCFRYHPLFREMLRAQLHYESPTTVPELHAAAAQWLAARELLSEAVPHAVAAGRWEQAASYAVDHLAIGDMIFGQDSEHLLDGLAALPTTETGPYASLLRAAQALIAFDLTGCAESLAQARCAPEWDGITPAAELTAATLDLLHAHVMADTDTGLSAAAAAEALLDRRVSQQLQRHPELAVVIQNSKGALQLRSGDVEQAELAFSAGVRDGTTAECQQLVVNCLGQLSLIAALRGDLRKAAALASQALAGLSPTRMLPGLGPGVAEVTLAWVNAEQYDLPAARRHAQRGGEALVGCNEPVAQAMLNLVQAWLLRARGDLVGALAMVDQARTGATELPQPLRDLMDMETVAIRLVRGLPYLSGPGGALPDVVVNASVLPVTNPASPLSVRVVGCLLEAEGHVREGQDRKAEAALGRALSLAAPQRLRRPFRDASPALRRLLRKGDGVIRRHRWLGKADPAAIPAPRSTGAEDLGDVIVEPLTSREREVLTHLAELLTTEEIAGVMFVSVNTVRTHVRSVLRKLQASRRNEAIRRARELQLIDV